MKNRLPLVAGFVVKLVYAKLITKGMNAIIRNAHCHWHWLTFNDATKNYKKLFKLDYKVITQQDSSRPTIDMHYAIS